MADITGMEKDENQSSQLAKAVAPGDWLLRLKQVAQETTVPPQNWEERLAELTMETLAYQILSLEGVLRQELAQALYQAGSLSWLTRQSVREIASVLKGQEQGSSVLDSQPASTKPAGRSAAIGKSTSPAPPPSPAKSALPQLQIAQPTPPKKPNLVPMFTVPPELRRLATIVETMSETTPFKPDGSWVEISMYDFDRAVAKMTDGLNSIQICEILGVEKLIDEANRRYKLNLAGGKGLSAALLVVAEFVIEREARQLHPKPRLLSGDSEGLDSKAVLPGQAAARAS